jgi:hypothetical protein
MASRVEWDGINAPLALETQAEQSCAMRAGLSVRNLSSYSMERGTGGECEEGSGALVGNVLPKRHYFFACSGQCFRNGIHVRSSLEAHRCCEDQ